jgi:Rhodanese-related sulfurtransferase
MKSGALLLDVRSGQEFASGHIKGSLNIGLGGQFASWAGTLIAIGTPIILLTNDLEALDEAVMRLARIGIESVVGYLENGLEGWSEAGFEITQTPVISVDDLQEELANQENLCVLDVRRKPEFEAGHIAGATNIPLAELPARIAEIDRQKTVTIVCASGYRSSIAKSVLERAEITNLMNMLGGMKAWKTAGFQTVG